MSPAPRSPGLREPRSLRSTVTGGIALIAGLAFLSALLLVLLTTRVRSAAEGVVASVRSLRLIEAAEVDLLLHSRAQDPTVRSAHESELRRRIAQAPQYVTSDEEQELLSSVERDVESYFVAARQTREGPPTADALARAFASLEALLDVNVTQSSAASDFARRADRLANAVGFPILIAMVPLAGFLIWWLWRRALEPVFDLGRAMQRFASGERSVRAELGHPVELQEMAERFNEMAGELERQREIQMSFLAGVAHDLRNPLTSIKTAVTVLSTDGGASVGESARALLPVVGRQVDHLDRLIGDLLDVARIESGRFDLRSEEIDVRLLATEAVELFQRTAPDLPLRLAVPEQPVLVRCDPDRVRQVLNNLISNAIKYSPERGGIVVTVGRDDGHASISVTDHGIGIAAEELQSVFEPFTRAKRASDSIIPGEGLGLFVARRIIEAHAGRLEVRSVPGVGSTFRIEIPA